MQMGFLVDIESILVISISNLHVQLKKIWVSFGIFVVCLIVGFEIYEADSYVVKIVNVLHKLQIVSNHVLIYYAVTTKLSKSICYVYVFIYAIISTHLYY